MARLRGLVTPLPTTAEALEMTPLELEITGQLLGDEMLALGINMDLAPVLDVVAGAQPGAAGPPPGQRTRKWWPNWAPPSCAAWSKPG